METNEVKWSQPNVDFFLLQRVSARFETALPKLITCGLACVPGTGMDH